MVTNGNPVPNNTEKLANQSWLSSSEPEGIEPYAFPVIAEYDTETEQHASFSVWQDGVNPPTPEPFCSFSTKQNCSITEQNCSSTENCYNKRLANK